MDENNVKKLIGETFNDIANAIETGKFGTNIKIGLTTLGSEHGVDALVKGAELASKEGSFEVVLIGPRVETSLENIEVDCEKDAHTMMEELLDSGYIQGCVTNHYNFDIGVSTVGRVITPAFGKDLLIATTTGTSDTDRTISMFENAIYGIITAKALGNNNPTVGILNVDNARSVERLLKKLNDNGYNINFGESMRSDGGLIMRGNDLLTSSVDVMVTDTLTGNILMKLFSSFNTGGTYEAVGYGYGPGIGFNHKRIINIISRASGTPVVANAIRYAAELAKGNLKNIIESEYQKLKELKFEKLIETYKQENTAKVETRDDFKMPEKEIVSAEISGIDILELEDAVTSLLKNGIYAESGMGCTGPIILVTETNLEKAKSILKENNYS
ncbi:glycine/sarcosine/betaine reductase complex component C subunit alpha [Haloplasma contractile]|uniref:Glycine reductase complex component C alpha subunit protein n=1 Tax=Haloplasma contractile SSD-17B TaxID=1033810 RepID=U2EDY2_9MOLU|nr:glycine/sarcosine/betaine reductase complex component C subunit alpha [Haloplasma contractile]ERJ13203.1 Glycine reductase complex component C alpha subunit protein [Haloplasma contractile SSD-17B]